MEIAITSLSDEKMSFKWSGTTPSLVNCLRRTILSEVPTLAIEDVVVDENGSPMSDEQIAHILGLVPLTTPKDKYVFPENCEKKREDQKCRATLSLDIMASEEIKNLTSGNLTSDDEEVKPVTDKIPITKIGPNQRIKLEAYAVLGNGRKHAKFQPVSTVFYRFQPVLEIDLERCDQCVKCVEACPKKAVTMSEDKTAIVDPELCTQCDECVKACPQDPPAAKLALSQNSVVFSIESTGAIPSGRILDEALTIMGEKFNNIREKLEEGVEAVE